MKVNARKLRWMRRSARRPYSSAALAMQIHYAELARARLYFNQALMKSKLWAYLRGVKNGK